MNTELVEHAFGQFLQVQQLLLLKYGGQAAAVAHDAVVNVTIPVQAEQAVVMHELLSL
jgi:hypothetical protein